MLAKFVAVAGFYALVVFQANAWPVGYPGAVPNPDVNPQPASSGISSLTAPNVPRANLAAAALLPAVAGAVTTYHYDNFRTGWDQTETSLTPANAGYIEQLHSISLDGQSDAQPLYMPNMNLGGLGTHNVLYVVTENDTVYAIDADSGAVLLTHSLGTPVPLASLPADCPNNDATVGVNSTPVIDPVAGRIYIIAYTYPNKVPTYTLHALSLATLSDAVTPQTITAAAHLINGSLYTFNPSTTRQRAALLLSNGNIYAGFTSFCDFGSRGWMLLWNATSMALNPNEALQNRMATAPNNQFLTTTWMSGFGPAGDTDGSVFLATGNSDQSGTTWNNVDNLEESVVRYGSDLAEALDHYTPNSPIWGQKPDDPIDADLGSGGVTLIPTQNGPYPYLAVAGGKTSGLLLLNRYHLGGYSNSQLGEYSLGFCWCGESYFADTYGVGHIVASFGVNVTTLTLQTNPTPALVNPITSPNLLTGQDPGFFTTVSSNGTAPNTAVVWALTRPQDSNPAHIYLYGFNPFTGAQLVRRTAGTWPNSNADANLLPTVANGKIYVASYKQLIIFGLGTPAQAQAFVAPPLPAEQPLPHGEAHQISGVVTAASREGLSLQLRSGQTVHVTVAAAAGNASESRAVGQPLRVRGDFTSRTAFKAANIVKLKPQPALWPRDR